jgi:undecaprenol kinase
MKNKPFAQRLGFAFAGIREAWAKESSFRTHVVCAALAFVLLAVVQPGLVWWALIGLVIALVIAAELINSAIERLADHLHPDLHPEIKAVKDLAAGAVLVFALASLWIGGLMIFSLFTR